MSRLPADKPLSLGWTDEFPLMAEVYSCAGSPYWAAKAFSPLLIDPSDPFWTAPAKPLPSENGDFVRAIPAAGMVVRCIDGDIELHNSESGINPAMRDSALINGARQVTEPASAWKWHPRLENFHVTRR